MGDEVAKKASARHHVWLRDEDLGVLDERKITVSDGFLIQNATGGRGQGLTVKQFMTGIGQLDPLAMQCLVWFLRFKKNPSAAGHISAIDYAFDDLKVEDEPDPTVESSGTSDAATSELSQNSAA